MWVENDAFSRGGVSDAPDYVLAFLERVFAHQADVHGAAHAFERPIKEGPELFALGREHGRCEDQDIPVAIGSRVTAGT